MIEMKVGVFYLYFLQIASLQITEFVKGKHFDEDIRLLRNNPNFINFYPENIPENCSKRFPTEHFAIALPNFSQCDRITKKNSHLTISSRSELKTKKEIWRSLIEI